MHRDSDRRGRDRRVEKGLRSVPQSGYCRGLIACPFHIVLRGQRKRHGRVCAESHSLSIDLVKKYPGNALLGQLPRVRNGASGRGVRRGRLGEELVS